MTAAPPVPSPEIKAAIEAFEHAVLDYERERSLHPTRRNYLDGYLGDVERARLFLFAEINKHAAAARDQGEKGNAHGPAT